MVDLENIWASSTKAFFVKNHTQIKTPLKSSLFNAIISLGDSLI